MLGFVKLLGLMEAASAQPFDLKSIGSNCIELPHLLKIGKFLGNSTTHFEEKETVAA